MKNQYFGDEHDYFKYSMLNLILDVFNEKLLLVWYLTENDADIITKKGDGNRLDYLKERKEQEYINFDKDTYQILKKILIQNDKINDKARDVAFAKELFEKKIQKIDFFANKVSCDNREKNESERKGWFEELGHKIQDKQIVFMDPDNGIKFTDSFSSKHVTYRELEWMWNQGRTVILYQHYPRVDRDIFSYGLAMKLSLMLHGTDHKGYVSYIKVGDVVYYFLIQERHKENYLEFIEGWEDRFVNGLGKIKRYKGDKEQEIIWFKTINGKEIHTKMIKKFGQWHNQT